MRFNFTWKYSESCFEIFIKYQKCDASGFTAVMIYAQVFLLSFNNILLYVGICRPEYFLCAWIYIFLHSSSESEQNSKEIFTLAEKKRKNTK